MSEPPVLPTLTLPGAPTMPAPVLEVPRALLPSYKPLVVPPSTLRPPPGVEGSNAEEEKQEKPTKKPAPKPELPQIPQPPKEVQLVEVPFTDVEIPMPSTEIMTAAATTAVISVAATLTATSIFKYLVTVMKPVVKLTWNKITKRKK